MAKAKRLPHAEAVAIAVEKARAAEREACAKIADQVLAREFEHDDENAIAACRDIAAAIRRRELSTHRAVERLLTKAAL